MANLLLVWEKALEILEREMPSVSYDTWIKDIKPYRQTSDSLYFEVSNELHKNIINQRYKQSIKSAIIRAAAETNTISDFGEFEPMFLTKSEVLSFEPPEPEPAPVSSVIEEAKTTLNPNYVFETYVVGNSNRLAHAACLGVSELPGRSYNPLFLYGGSGLGKTHLMHAIGNHINQEYPEAQVLYVSSETFTNEFIASIASNVSGVKEQFRTKYRSCDVLLIDDIQFIADKFGVQEEIFHTFNTLRENNKQIVITSDKPPKEIPKIEDRLRSRFEWGLSADIQQPDYETKFAILLKKAEHLAMVNGIDLKIPREVLDFIAKKATSNIRELEGSLQKVIAYARLHNAEINLELAENALRDFFTPAKERRVTPGQILDMVCDHFSISSEDIKSRKKNREISQPRQICMYLIRNLTDASLPKIGEVLGGKDHTTVMHAIDKISREMEDNIKTKTDVEDIIAKVKS